jgi:uroporphyrinogen decarboxylase
MNSRRRVIETLGHSQPDRPCLDLSSHRSSGISAIAYGKLRDYLGLEKKPIRVYDMIQQLAIVDDDILDMFGVDLIEMGRGFLVEDKDWKPWVLPDGRDCEIPYYVNVEKRVEDWYLLNDKGLELGLQKKGSLYFEQSVFPLAGMNIEEAEFCDLEEKFNDVIWSAAVHPGAHLGFDDEGLRQMSHKAKAFRESTDRAIVGLFGGNMFEAPQSLFRMDNYLMQMALYPEATERFSEKLCELHIANLEKWMGAVGPYVDVVLFGDDLGGQNGPLLSPEMYRRFYKPYHKKIWGRCKELCDVKVLLHCCGGVYPLLGDLIEAGLDAINPVQISCAGMDSVRLKREFGSSLTFWGGGCDTREILGNSKPGEIKDHVRNQIDIFNSDGGFVFQQVHNIMANVPPENIVAMLEAVRDY